MTVFVNAGAQTIAEYEEGSAVPAREYVYGSYVDEPLMMARDDGQKLYFHANHLYSVQALTDSTGAVVERYSFDAYGKRTVLASDGTTVRTASMYGQQKAFTGQYEDAETGLVYGRARMYHTTLGRWIGRDPWMKLNAPSAKDGYRDGLNLYAAYFAPNKVDPTGRGSWFGCVGTIQIIDVGGLDVVSYTIICECADDILGKICGPDVAKTGVLDWDLDPFSGGHNMANYWFLVDEEIIQLEGEPGGCSCPPDEKPCDDDDYTYPGGARPIILILILNPLLLDWTDPSNSDGAGYQRDM